MIESTAVRFAIIVGIAIYFCAFGLVLSEFGVSLAAYLASASIIGLAVSFGSQGVVQDMITGLTVVFSDLLDVGDMVDIGGQVGIIESVHDRSESPEANVRARLPRPAALRRRDPGIARRAESSR